MPGFLPSPGTQTNLYKNTKFPMQNASSPSVALTNLHEVHVWWRTPIGTSPPSSLDHKFPFLAVNWIGKKKTSCHLQSPKCSQTTKHVFFSIYLSSSSGSLVDVVSYKWGFPFLSMYQLCSLFENVPTTKRGKPLEKHQLKKCRLGGGAGHMLVSARVSISP